MSAAAKPKSAKPGGRAAGPAAEPDAATLLPPDLPAECPFPVTWRPAVFAVSAAEGALNLSAIKDAFKQLHVLSHISMSDLAARLQDPADPLCAELAAAAAEGQVHASAGEGASVPTKLAAKLLQRQFSKDESLAWKFELVRRRDQLARLEAEAQMVHDALAYAESAQAAATIRLQAVKARLPQPAPPPAAQQDADKGAATADEDPDLQEDSAAAAPVPKLAVAAAQEVALSPEQRRALTEAQAGLEAADDELSAARTAASSAVAGLAAAHASLNGPFHHFEPYWVDGLPSTAAGLSAAVAAGVPLRAAVWLHPSAHAPGADSSSTRLPSTGGTRPASGVSARHSSAGGPAAAVVYSLPCELQQLQDAVRAAAWDDELSGLLVLQLPVEDAASPFTRVPAGSAISDPAWAAASSAAAAARAATASAAAAAAAAAVPALDTKPGAGPPGKPGSAAAGATKTSSSGSARPGSSAAGSASGAAAAALPEEVPGCKELARALLTATDQAKHFDQWREQGVHVYRMPAPTVSAVPGGGSGQRMGYYQHLLDSVPPERQNVPLLLHAIMEQVQLNSLADTQPGAAAEAEQAILQAQVEGAISAAFSSLVDEQSCCFVQEPCQQRGGLTLLAHGDDFAAASCGLTTGYVHSPDDPMQSAALSHPAGATHSSTQQQGSSTSDWSFAAGGLSSQDVDAVESHMLQLLQVHGLAAADAHEGAEHDKAFDPAVQRQLQQAELKSVCQGVHHATVQRSQLLQAAAAMLPPEVQAAHAADILSRSHQEPLQPQVLKQVLQHAILELPHVSSMQYQPAGAELLALYAGPQLEPASSSCMPHVMTFGQYFQKLLQGSCQAPELAPQVYEMSEAAAQQQWQSRLLYTDTGGIASTGTDGLLALHQGPTAVRLLQPQAPGKPYQLVATLQHGTVVAATVLAAQATSAQPETPAALDPAAAADDAAAARTTETDSVAGAAAAAAAAAAAVGDKTCPGSPVKGGQPHGVPHSPGRGSLYTVPEDAASQEDSAAASSGGGGDAAAGGQTQAPSWAGLCVSTPQGTVVQLSTDGCVVMQPVKPPGAQCMQSSGVNVLGAPLAAGSLQANVSASTSALHALLPNGTLIKAAAVGGATTSTTEPEALSILHPDGTVSQQQQQDLTLAGVAGDLKQRVAGWLRTSPHGEQSWAVDVEALQHLRASLAQAAEEEATAAATAAEAAAAAAAEAVTGKKGSKGSKKDLHKQASSKPHSAKHSAQQQQQQPQHEQAAAAAAAAGTGSPDPGATPRGGEAQHAQQAAAAAAEAALQDLEQQPTQSMGSIRAVRLTDADTRAVVTTREDHLLLVDYPDGSRLLQDAEGCRLSHVAGAWLFEAAGLPAVRGDSCGVMLEPCPGVSLSWDACSSCVKVVHTATGAAISLSPTGHVVYSPDGEPPKLLLDCCWDLAGEQHQAQQQESSVQAPDEQDSAAAQHQPELLLSGQEDGQQQEDQQEQGGEAALEPAGLQGRWQTLADVCSQPDCWGLLGLDLRTGEAVLHEEGACKLHIAPGGCVKVWQNSPRVQAAGDEHGQGDTSAGTEEQADDTAPVSAAAAAAAVAAAAAAAAEMEEGLTDEEVAAKKAAAVAAAQAAAEAATAEAAAAEEAAAAARALPKPVAPGIKPRLFVIDPGSGAGYELLPREVVEQFAALVSTQPGLQHMQRQAVGAEEPSTVCHTFLSSHAHRSPALQPLEVAQPTQVLPLQVYPSQSLVTLRRVETVAPAEWQAGQGLRLPRIAALNPWHVASAAGAAAGDAAASGCASCELAAADAGLAATRLPGTAGGSSGPGAGACGGQVVVVREVLELPELGPDVQEQVVAALASWQAHKTEQQQLLLARTPSFACGGRQQQQQQQQEDAEAVRGMLEVAGFTTLPIDAVSAAATAGEAPEQPATPSSSAAPASARVQSARAVSPAGAGRLEQVKHTIIEQERAAAAAHAAAQAEAVARAAAAADAKKKPYRPWVKKVGLFDNTPQKPEAGQTLKYFDTQEGLTALSDDPCLRSGVRLTKANLSPPKPVQPASAGKQQVPGVYLSSSTALCEPGAAEPLDADSYAAGLAVLAGSSSPRSSGAGSPPPQHAPLMHAPLMHAGRPTRLGGPVVAPQQQQGSGTIAAVAGGQASTVGFVSEQLGSTTTGSSTAGKGPVLDVYGQPRVVPPALPSTYSKARAAGSINAQYLSREGLTRRAAKTSSASLVRASGKEGTQVVLRPDHLHFGSIPSGTVVHRTARLLNGSADVVRFTILRPQLPLRVLYKPAPLPPGMEATFTIELVAEQPGDFVGEVTVKTETNVFCLSVSAKVLPAAAEEPTAGMQQQAVTGSDGVAAGPAGEGEAAVGGV